jgi:hypothetical protein
MPSVEIVGFLRIEGQHLSRQEIRHEKSWASQFCPGATGHKLMGISPSRTAQACIYGGKIRDIVLLDYVLVRT